MNRIIRLVETQIRFQILQEERQMYINRMMSAEANLPKELKRHAENQESIILPTMRQLQD